jgi:hypothetical protein
MSDDLKISRLDACAFLALVEAIAAKHERRLRMVRQPEITPEIVDEELAYVG